MKHLLKTLRFYRKEAISGPLFKLFEALFELFVPLVIAQLIDRGIGGADRPFAIRACLLLMLLGLAGLAFSLTAQYFAARAAVGTSSRLRRELFDQIQRLSFADLDAVGTSSLITRMTGDILQIQTGINMFLRLFLRSPFIVFGAMILAFTIDTRTAWIFVGMIAILSVIVFGILLISLPLQKKAQQKLDAVTASVRENLTGVRVIRAFCREEKEAELFRQRNRVFTAAQLFVGRICAFLNPVTFAVVNLAILLLLRTGAIRIQAGALTQGQVIALYNYLSQILVELVKLANLMVTVTKATACAGRVGKILDLTPSLQFAPETPAPAGEGNTVLALQNVSFRYPGAGADALQHIDFTVKRGETVGIIGGTGSGKSTLVHLISHFYDATEGTVLFEGIPVQCYARQELAKRIGIVLQKTELFSGTIRDNLRYGAPDADDTTLLAALETAQGLNILSQKEGGLDAEVGQGGRNLSGGQRQRLSIARAIAKKPQLLILDDSASALDYATDAGLRKALRTLPDRPTVLIVSQRTASIRHADRILVLEDGQAVGFDTHEALRASCPLYREICLSQEKSNTEEEEC